MFHLSANGLLGCFHVLVIINSAAVNTGVHVSLSILGFLSVYAQQWDCWVVSSVQSLSHVWLFVTPWTAARQASQSISRSSPKPMSIELVMPSNHLILCHPFLLLPSICPDVRVFFNESALCIRWPKYWSFSFNISPSKEYSGLISFRMDWLEFLAPKGLSRVFSNTTVQKHEFFSTQLSL